jgi:hypothetical protein
VVELLILATVVTNPGDRQRDREGNGDKVHLWLCANFGDSAMSAYFF